MKRSLTLAIVAVCIAAPLSFVSANPYSAAPRIIHVPDANERASIDNENWPAADDRANLREREAPLRIAPVHRPHPVVRQAKPHRTLEPKRTQHRRPYSTSGRAVPLPAPVEHRAILSAPPPLVDGLTPIRPTPRFGAPVPTPHHPADQHAAVPAPAARAASEPQEVAAESAGSAIPPNAPTEEQPAAPAEK